MQDNISINLNAADLRKEGETIADHELARRLSEAIIDAVHQHKERGYELLSMDFNAGQVTIHFKLQTEKDKAKLEKESPPPASSGKTKPIRAQSTRGRKPKTTSDHDE